MIIKWFYKIWVDAILMEKSKPNNENSWKGFILAGMTFILSLNIFSLYMILILFQINFIPYVDSWMSSYFKIEIIRYVLVAVIVGYAPVLFINYFLIFYKNKYEYLIKKYGDKEDTRGRLFAKYFIISAIIFFSMGIGEKLFEEFCR